jgi:hypothetical protein
MLRASVAHRLLAATDFVADRLLMLSPPARRPSFALLGFFHIALAPLGLLWDSRLTDWRRRRLRLHKPGPLPFPTPSSDFLFARLSRLRSL